MWERSVKTGGQRAKWETECGNLGNQQMVVQLFGFNKRRYGYDDQNIKIVPKTRLFRSIRHHAWFYRLVRQ